MLRRLPTLHCVRICLYCALILPVRIPAGNLYIATNGTPAGPGTIGQPYDLMTAISQQVSQPGDTFWLRGGTYILGHVNTTIQGATGRPITFRELPGEHARINGSLTFWNSVGNVILRDLELFSSDTNRVSSQTGVGFNPTDITILPGIASYVPDMSFINLVVHDQTRHGFYISQSGTNNLVYGCVIYNNGWRSPDNAEGHGIYVQGEDGDREVVNNLVFNQSGANLHIYENDPGFYLAGITIDGNVAFNAGAIQNIRYYRDTYVGVDLPAISADRIVFKNNLGYLPLATGVDDAAQIGRDGINGGVAVLNNYLPAGLELNNWIIAAVSGNTLSAQTTNYVVSLNQTQAVMSASWNNNNYVVPATSWGFLSDASALSFAQWQGTTGFDANSSYSLLEGPVNDQIFVQTNQFEAGRANIIVYNWSNLSTVAVDVSSALTFGMPYEVRNAQDYFAPPVLSGIYSNLPLNLPMNGLTVAVPNGPMLTAPSTSPIFNVFVLLPRLVRLQGMMAGKGQVQVTWPTNAGHWVLQSSSTISAAATWTDVPTAPVLAGSNEVVTNTVTGNMKYYRLRPAP